MLNLSVKVVDSVAEVALHGRFDTVSSTLFSGELSQILETEEYLIVDFSGCNYLSSSGIRQLMMAAKILGARGGALMLTGLPNEVMQVIEVTGLRSVFCLFDSAADARNEILRLKKSSYQSYVLHSGNSNFQFQQIEKYDQEAILWNSYDIAGYDELGIALGIGSPAESLVEDENNRGLFISLGNCAGFLPFDESLSPDFRIPQQPAGAGVFVRWALSFGKRPQSIVTVSESSGLSPGQITDSILKLSEEAGTENLRAVLIAEHGNKPSLALLILDMIPENEGGGNVFPEELTRYFQITPNGNRLAGARFILDSLPLFQPGESFEDYLKKILTIENVEGVEPPDLSVSMVSAEAWLFHDAGSAGSDTKRLKIETVNELFIEPYKRFLTRRLYKDSSRVVIQQMHGGYSAQTFQVDSYDSAGRKLRPTVMKMANRAIIIREADRCQRFSLPYIMNNSAIVLGTEFYGETGALRYNFVGIGGEQSQLKWLTHYFNDLPVGKLEPLFDKIFTLILKPWYGQPIREKIYPYRDHDPVSTFFPLLCETAEELLSISADDKYFTVKETGQELINPYWFLKHEYKKRRDHAIDYFTSVCHGDLNMQNILLDNDQNVYLIDFSETRPRSVISDFARLEAIIMIEQTPLNSSADLKEMMEFAMGFYNTGSLEALPANSWKGSNAAVVNRNIALTLRLRHYGIDCVGGETTIVPYYIALLEWVLPIVCYGSASLNHKKLSAYVAMLICEKLMVTD